MLCNWYPNAMGRRKGGGGGTSRLEERHYGYESEARKEGEVNYVRISMVGVCALLGELREVC